MWKTKKIAVSQPFYVIFAHLTAIFENFLPPPGGGSWRGHVKKIFLLKCAENYVRHTTQNSEAFKKPFFCYKKFRCWGGGLNHPPPPKERVNLVKIGHFW